MKKLTNLLNKNKKISVASVVALASTSAMAAPVKFAEAIGFTGDVDLKYFYSAAAIVVTATAGIWAVKKAISIFR